MNRRILNVDNGPGSNGLRGGIKQYSPKTTTGPWLDTYGGPIGYKRGFTSSDFQTEAQHAQLGVIGKPPGVFGAEIPLAETRDEKGNPLGSSGTEHWISNAKATHPNFGVIKKEDTAFKLLKPRLPLDKLLEYRRKWTCDNDAQRKMRFQTESRIASRQAVPDKFATTAVRILPGTPRSMEEYRRRLVERYGIFALSALKLEIGPSLLTCQEFRDRIQNAGVAIKPYELSQILAYITPSTTHVSPKEIEGFHMLMKGHTDGFSAQDATSVFFSLCNTADEGVTLPLGSLLCSIDGDRFPDIAEGFAHFLPGYIGDAQEVTVHQFVEMLDDMHSSAPIAYGDMMKSVWRF